MPQVPVSQVLSKEEWQRMKDLEQFHAVMPAYKEGHGWQGLIVRPSGVSFATQNEGEQVFILSRRHWITNTGWIINAVIKALMPLILVTVLNIFNINLIPAMGLKLGTLLLVAYYSLILTNTIRHFVDWYFNLYLVTNERVIDYDFKAFTSKAVSETALAGVEDVKEKVIGFLPTFFDYGDIQVFSDAEKNVITFHQVPRPSYVRDKITDLAKVAKSLRDNQ